MYYPLKTAQTRRINQSVYVALKLVSYHLTSRVANYIPCKRIV